MDKPLAVFINLFLLCTLGGCYLATASSHLPVTEEDEKSKIVYPSEVGWTEWSLWTECTKSNPDGCNSGSQLRHRRCQHPETPCSGVFEESRDCPVVNCKNILSRGGQLQEIAPASYNSFISQECDTDIKYSVSSPQQAKSIPGLVQKRFIQRSTPIRLGYFNRKKLQGNPSKNLRHMMKYCFEPAAGLTTEEMLNLSYFNRNSRSSLYPEQRITDYPDYFKHVSGLAIVVDSEMRLVAAYFALPSSSLGYRKVFYRRWKGMGFEETL